jgi:hypothetical protein
MVEEAKERRLLTPSERAIRNEARRTEAKKAMTDHERAQKAFYENRARLKAERLARETELKAKQMKPGPRSRRTWTPEEDAQLLALLESKMDRPSIARKLKRTVAAITIRLMVLRATGVKIQR